MECDYKIGIKQLIVLPKDSTRVICPTSSNSWFFELKDDALITRFVSYKKKKKKKK